MGRRCDSSSQVEAVSKLACKCQNLNVIFFLGLLRWEN